METPLRKQQEITNQIVEQAKAERKADEAYRQRIYEILENITTRIDQLETRFGDMLDGAKEKEEEFKRGDKVMVRFDGTGAWHKRYFAYKEEGYFFTFASGATEWSSCLSRIAWNQCRRPTQEELEDAQ